MTTKLDPDKITRILNQSIRKLDDETLSSLQQSRAKALQSQAAPVRMLRFAGNNLTHSLLPHSARQWVTITMLALALAVGANLWWQHHHEQQIDELDVAILTDELPIELFID